MDVLKYSDPSDKLKLALTALVGVLGTAAAGIDLTAVGIKTIPQIAALAVPGVVAFLLSYLIYQVPQTVTSFDAHWEDELAMLLPELATALPQQALVPVTASASAETASKAVTIATMA